VTTLAALFRRFLRNPSPWLLGVSFLIGLVLRISTGGFSWRDAAVAGFWLAYWPLHEWLLHVFTLHAKPKKLGRFTLDFPVAKAHRAHHLDPWDLDLVYVPLSTYLLLPFIWALFFLVLPTPLALSAATVYFGLSLFYEWIHFLTHTRYVPRGWWYKRIWLNHRLHHFKNEKHWFGVTRLLGDKLLGTAPMTENTPISPTARTLGIN
jgi:hypothetical protein